ncbi:receptor-like kinase TMK4 [Olea europaea subsp. europaea]|uniref:non-specific serine/threonine protein kinase n=1 Tax=Olea europaea subsp. europaea TaxID=158383 RepID=A0A8S0TZN4_OLEEU|nr:receptor-like kinase TMK4 [Olea europaea subsp. europaea]
MNGNRYKSTIILYDTLISIITITAFLHYVSADDATIMAALAKSLSSHPSGWVGPKPCKWQGVDCDSSGKISSISLPSMSLTGQIPSNLNQLSNLKSLHLQNNFLSGPLPSLSNLASLQDVNLDGNNFSSVPRDFLSGLTSLQTFSINNNSNLPPWIIPETLKDSTSLVSFNAGKANLVGQIPDIFGSFPSLQNLRLSYNNLTGSLPLSFSNSGIQNLLLNNQMMGLSGTIDVLRTMSQLTEVWLHVNKFSGPIPDLSSCRELYDIQLRDNFLTGVIPESFTKLPKLKTAMLQNNVFQGPQPGFSNGVQVNLGTSNNFCNPSPGPCDPQVTTLLEVAGALDYPMVLAQSWKGNNPCQNWIHISCDVKGSVTVINFAKQNWFGTISPAISNLTEIKTILLNDNNLTSTIPDSLTSLKQLQLLDVSNNNLSGKIPKFSSGVTLKTTGNTYIGIDLPPNSPPGSTSKGANNQSRAKNGTNSSLSAWVIVVSVVAAILVVLALCYAKKRSAKYKWVNGSELGNSEKENEARKNVKSTSTSETPIRSSSEKIDYHVYDGGNIMIPIEVLREVTNSFSENNILGRGGFGVVYRGQLHDGTRIAVKRMESNILSNKGMNEFKAEIEVLTKVRHRNLVALHGFCDNGNERLLVYEYMPQGSLGQHLFHWDESGLMPLTWNQRVTIALDVARGVEYLHSLAQQSFIHRDLKPTNILLGDDMRAKVSDFGLVRSAPDGKYSVETRLAGTFGYLAPEYAATGRVTTKVDVFAFGVVLMEIITGRKALEDSLPDDQTHLVPWFRRLIQYKDSVRASLDPTLQTDEETFSSIWQVAELAGYCTAREAQQRPDMSHVVNALSPLVDHWKPTLEEEESFGVDFNMSLPQALQKWKANEDTPSSSSMFTSDFYNSSN